MAASRRPRRLGQPPGRACLDIYLFAPDATREDVERARSVVIFEYQTSPDDISIWEEGGTFGLSVCGGPLADEGLFFGRDRGWPSHDLMLRDLSAEVRDLVDFARLRAECP